MVPSLSEPLKFTVDSLVMSAVLIDCLKKSNSFVVLAKWFCLNSKWEEYDVSESLG